MESKETTLILYSTQYSCIEDLSDENKGILLNALFSYIMDGEIEDIKRGIKDGETRMAFKFIRDRIDHDKRKYAEKCATNKRIAQERESKRKQTKAKSKPKTETPQDQEHPRVAELWQEITDKFPNLTELTPPTHEELMRIYNKLAFVNNGEPKEQRGAFYDIVAQMANDPNISARNNNFAVAFMKYLAYNKAPQQARPYISRDEQRKQEQFKRLQGYAEVARDLLNGAYEVSDPTKTDYVEITEDRKI